MEIASQQFLQLNQGNRLFGKTADAEDVEAALLAEPNSKAQPPENPMSADRVNGTYSESLSYVIEMFQRQLTSKNA